MIEKLHIPDEQGIKKGLRGLLMWAKVDGEMKLVSLIAASTPYKKGKSSTYVDVFGAGVPRRGVNIKKLLTYK